MWSPSARKSIATRSTIWKPRLLSADLGTATTATILQALREKVDRKQVANVDELKRVLKEELLAILNSANERPVQKVDGEPEVILVVG